MATWGVEARIKYRAWNTSTNAGVAGDSANHTLTLRRAGTDSAFVGTVNDLGNGVYEAVVSGTLAETYELAMRGTSSTADVVLFFEAPVRTVKAAPTLTEIANQIEADHGAGSYVDTGAPLDATATEAAALAALVSHGVLVTGGDVNLVSVAGVAVAGVGDFRADVSGLLTKVQFDAALPDNFSGLAIDPESGAVIAGNMVAAAPTAADIWAYATRSLTVSSGGATAQEVWEYATRELTAIDLSGLEINALTPEQAALLEAIGEKTAIIGTDGALAEIVSPIGSGGEITLYSGVDYVDTAAGPLVIPVPAAVQSRVPALGQPVYFQGRRRRTGTDYFDVDGIVIDDPDSPGSKAVSIPIPRGSIDSEFPFDDSWFYFVGDRPASLQDAFIAGSLKLCPGPIVPA